MNQEELHLGLSLALVVVDVGQHALDPLDGLVQQGVVVVRLGGNNNIGTFISTTQDTTVIVKSRDGPKYRLLMFKCSVWSP